MNKESLLKPMEVRFTEPADIERYGADWHTYDELAIVTQPAKVLVPLELEIGAPLVVAMDGFRESSVYGDSVAAWLALHFEGTHVPWPDFQPAIMLAEWRTKPDVEPGKAPAAVSDPADSSPSADTQPSMDTVALPSMPVGG
jgi:hypothetical protein